MLLNDAAIRQDQPPFVAAASVEWISDPFEVLDILVSVAQVGGGWSRRGVRGWLFYREIERVLARSGKRGLGNMESLTRHRGYVTCLEVRDFAGGRVFLYRATDQGSRALQTERRCEHVPLPPYGTDRGEDARMLFMPLGGWAALVALRDALEDSRGKPRFGEHGWLQASEMPEVLNTTARIDTGDLYWLARRGLIERRYLPNAARPIRPAVVWHVTGRGQRVQVVDDFGIMSGLNTVLQVEVVDGDGPLETLFAPAITALIEQDRANLNARFGLYR